jgi:hypothetical protein
LLRTFAPGRLFVNTMPVPGQPRLLVTGERRGHVNLWDIETGECLHVIVGTQIDLWENPIRKGNPCPCGLVEIKHECTDFFK